MPDEETEEEKAKRRGRRIERMKWLCKKVESIDQRTKDLDDRVPDDHEERLEDVEKLATRHSWYWRGFGGILTFFGASIALAWKQISHLLLGVFGKS